ncbi:transcription factor E3 isoform X2 [Folsomia candida]|uniref:Microphthalmia-associated transcription factor n=1 Tax=Folsomia candida TaxID=158441 RepID=A0A226F0W3_FOLCA|nr:transcription factor E3 isoform X2 [Folsomia candida]OXA63425.1 Microphthalmia-associated transcription factor [Folsomia candida]
MQLSQQNQFFSHGGGDDPAGHWDFVSTSTPPPPPLSVMTSQQCQGYIHLTPQSFSYTQEYAASVPTNNKGLSLSSLRTSTKQELHRMKAIEDSRREQEVKSCNQPPPQSTPVDLPLSCSPQTTMVPREVLQQVKEKTRLENPTRYHLFQCAIEKATQGAMGGVHKGGSVPPATYAGGFVGMDHSSTNHRLRLMELPTQPGSAPPNVYTREALSPLVLSASGGGGPSPLPPHSQSINSSLGTSVTSGCSTDLNDPLATLDVDDVVDATELNMLTLSEINELISQEETDPVFSYSTPSASNNFMSSPQTPGSTSGPQSNTPMQSPGTPDGSSGGGHVKLNKDRQKKDNHNKIERRRRYLINDMINLQGLQLPKPNEPYYDKFGDVKQNKGAILQASVDYIQLLKDENDEFRHKDSKTQVKLQQTEQEKRKLLLRIQELEQICIRNGIAIPEEALTWRSQPDKISNLINGPIIKQEPKFSDLMDEGHMVGDPMLGPGPVEDFAPLEDVGMELS